MFIACHRARSENLIGEAEAVLHRGSKIGRMPLAHPYVVVGAVDVSSEVIGRIECL